MKNKCLLIILFLSTMQLSAQYVNIIDTNALWSVWDRKYYIEGDTLINAINYSVVYEKSDPQLSTTIKHSYIREDSASQRVFIHSISKEYLLYDFSLNKGDTVTVHNFIGTTLIVDSVDYITLGGVLRKRMKMSSYVGNTTWFDEYWIEGVGSNNGLTYSGMFNSGISDITYPILVCYQLDGALLYEDSNFTNCSEPWPLDILEDNIAQVEIYPNPLNGIINVQLPPNSHKAIVRIYNLNGALLLKQELTQNETRIDLEALQLAPQALLIEIDAEGKVYNKKVVVQD